MTLLFRTDTAHDLAPQVVGGKMPHHSQIGVYRTDKLLPVGFHVIGRACRQAVQAVDGIVAEADVRLLVFSAPEVSSLR